MTESYVKKCGRNMMTLPVAPIIMPSAQARGRWTYGPRKAMNTPKMMVGQSLAVSMKPNVEADKENCFSTWKRWEEIRP